MEKRENVTMAFYNAASKLIAEEEGLEYYDYDADIWSVADYQCGCRSEYYHKRLFLDDIHPNRVLASRYMEKLLGLRFTRFYYDFRSMSAEMGGGGGGLQTPSMFVPRLELCPRYRIHQGVLHRESRRSAEGGDNMIPLYDILLLCHNIEIPIIPKTKHVADQTKHVHDMRVGGDDWSSRAGISHRVRRILFRQRFNITTDYYLSLTNTPNMLHNTANNPEGEGMKMKQQALRRRERFYFTGLDDEIMLLGLYGLGDFYYHNAGIIAPPLASTTPSTATAMMISIVTHTIPKEFVLPRSVSIVILREYSTDQCYLLSEQCEILYTLPSCKVHGIIPKTVIQSQSPAHDLFIRWKYGQGSSLSKPLHDGVLLHLPHAEGMYVYMKHMMRYFVSAWNNVTEVVQKLEELRQKGIETRQVKIADAVWYPEQFCFLCLPIVTYY